jgi:hypothetical protein
MPSMKILVSVFGNVGGEVRGSRPGPGHRFFFSEYVTLLEYDGVKQKKQLAGSHSGFTTTVRIAAADDQLYPEDSILTQYEATYRFNTVPNTPLKKGQVTARGTYLGIIGAGGFTLVDVPVRFAITGGTEAYAKARGEIFERPENRLLDIQL